MRPRAFMRTMVFALGALLAGCADTSDSWTDSVQPYVHALSSMGYKSKSPEDKAAAIETRVEALIDEVRLRLDPQAKALALDPELVEAARAHSKDMVQKKYLAHTSPDGDTTATMILAKDAKFRGLLGENIAAQYYSPTLGIDPDDFAKRFVASWLASPTHKQNLSYAAYDRTGVGVAISDNEVYVTQLFATDLGLPEPKDDAPVSVTQPSSLPPASAANAPAAAPASTPAAAAAAH